MQQRRPVLEHGEFHRRQRGPRRGIRGILNLAVSVLAIFPTFAQSPKITARAPVKDFTLPFFNDAGHRTMLVRGGEALLANPERVTIHELTLTVFSGHADNRVDTVILSPAATVIPAEKAVTGEQVVRLVRDDLEVSGEAWRYDHDAKKILINRNVHIVFRTELKDILK
ncbi:MAG TPA: hypothetical protein VGD81_09345 [Opitutaceae bacterium]